MIHDAFLEIDVDGMCMAHVLDLPGCFVRADSRSDALASVHVAIRDYYDWLRRHGEEVDEDHEPDQVRVVEESAGFGPFSHGDPAALFTPDRRPLSRGELERHLQLAGYNRDDLLMLAQPLDDETLDWRAWPDEMTVREILRHIGNVEQWYVSRIVDPDTLPAEWQDDEHMPIFDFLAMERRTAFERLRQLTSDELAAFTYPQRWTRHPDEPWTARKALRRLLEHEREHIDHIEQVLTARRKMHGVGR